MSKTEIKGRILNLINTIKEQSVIIETEQSLSNHQLEPIFSTIEKLYKEFAVYSYLNTSIEVVPPVQLKEVQQVRKSELIVGFEEKPLVETISPKKESAEPQLMAVQMEMETVSVPVVETVTVLSDLSEVNVPVVETKEPELIESLKTESPQIATNSTIPDIRTKIGINDKFQFISELLSGNGHAYDALIQELNEHQTLDATMIHLKLLQEKHQWKEESEALKRLLNVLGSRFSK
jgi:hypothetical protein